MDAGGTLPRSEVMVLEPPDRPELLILTTIIFALSNLSAEGKDLRPSSTTVINRVHGRLLQGQDDDGDDDERANEHRSRRSWFRRDFIPGRLW